MGLQVNIPTQEQEQQDAQKQASEKKAFNEKVKGTDFFKSLDLPESQEEQVQEEQKEVVEEQPEEQPEEVQEDEQLKQEEVEEVVKEEKVEEDEEVIPKSKVQQRIDELTAKIKSLEYKLQESEAKGSVPKDETSQKIEAMSEAELENTIEEIKLRQIQLKDDEVNLRKLVTLERQVTRALITYPQRFQQRQIESFDRAVHSTLTDPEIVDHEKELPEIKAIATEIYQRYPKLSKDVDGQAQAWELAVMHYKKVNQISKAQTSGKSEISKLKSQVNTLKKKTVLDSKVIKGNTSAVHVDSLRKRAIGGTQNDKRMLVRDDPRFNVDAMIPDELK